MRVHVVRRVVTGWLIDSADAASDTLTVENGGFNDGD
jgi:hypothetical protein